MAEDKSRQVYIFPVWSNLLYLALPLLFLGGVLYAGVIVTFGFSPRTTDVGYQPAQPVPYSHALHVGRLGLDCRYCHSTVEVAAMAALPPTQTCMNCHKMVRAQSEKLIAVLASYSTGMPIEWVRVHDLPDYVYFNHSAHVRRGIGCVSCHGRVDTMETVYQVEPLSMGWCLSCHRAPDKHLRPPEAATQMDWAPAGDPEALGERLRESLNIAPPEDCNACHR